MYSVNNSLFSKSISFPKFLLTITKAFIVLLIILGCKTPPSMFLGVQSNIIKPHQRKEDGFEWGGYHWSLEQKVCRNGKKMGNTESDLTTISTLICLQEWASQGCYCCSSPLFDASMDLMIYQYRSSKYSTEQQY